MEYGIPADRNYLNDMLREGNRKFDSLLEKKKTIYFLPALVAGIKIFLTILIMILTIFNMLNTPVY
jgi:hypothetical protein